MLTRSYVSENDAERARLEAMLARMSDDEIARSIGHGWTAGVAIAHLAFWDRLWLAKLEEWQRTGVVEMPEPERFFNEINDGMLPWWRTIAPAQARHEAIAAAEAMDAAAAAVPGAWAESILPVRPRTLNRAIHRREHLDEIERALAG